MRKIAEPTVAREKQDEKTRFREKGRSEKKKDKIKRDISLSILHF